MATHSSILAWIIPCTEEPGWLQPTESESQTWLKWLSTHTKWSESEGKNIVFWKWLWESSIYNYLAQSTSLFLFTFLHWRRKWQPTSVFLPGESQGMGEPGGLLSMGSHRVGHNWSDLAAVAAAASIIQPFAINFSCSEGLWKSITCNFTLNTKCKDFMFERI